MKKRVFDRALLILFYGLLTNMFTTSGTLWAQTTTTGARTNAITTAVPFLLICSDSKSGGLGEAGVALAHNNGANAMYWNPSAMAFLPKRFGFGVNYTPWLRALGIPDINHGYLPVYYNMGEKGGVVGASLTYFSLGDIQFTNDGGIETGRFSANEFAFSVSYAHLITENLSAGASLRYIRSNLAGATQFGGITTEPGQSVAGDISIFYKKQFKTKSLPITLTAGANISNIGSKMRYTQSTTTDFIPTNLKIGYALKFEIDEYNAITFTNDFNKLLVPSPMPDGSHRSKALLEGMFGSFGDAPGGFKEEMQEFNISVGTEYSFNDRFMVRAGLFYEAPNKGNRKFITLGAGFRFSVVELNFAYLASLEQNHPLQNTLRFSLNLDFQ